tara:strand:+ start:4074 stop:4439 length:366 start_codon:yes stop_codon:yes gene_type:complete
MPERMTKEEAKIQRAIEAARIAKQTLLEETRDRMPLEVEEDLVKVTRPKAENVTIKIPNQDKEGYGLAGVEKDYTIKKSDSRFIMSEFAEMDEDELRSMVMEKIENMTKMELVEILENYRL